MNILPLVLSFLLVLSFSSFSLLKERMATQYETKSFLGHMATIREARNASEEDLFRGWNRAITSENKEPAASATLLRKSKRSSEEITRYDAVRKLRRSCSYSQLNLAPLKESTEEKLQKIATELLDTLYGHAVFYQEAQEKTPKLSSELLSFILKTTKDDFTSLLEESSPYHKTLYKMLKGTNAYDTKEKKGYPPLEDFFTMDQEEKSLFRFHFASRPLLEVIFDKEITEQIFAKEKEKWLEHTPYLTEEELNTLILQTHTPNNPLTILSPHINYTTQAPKKTFLPIIDKTTKIRLKQEVCEWEYKE